LVELGAYIEAADEIGCTPLLCACARGQVAVAEYLLERGCNIESRNNRFGYTALHWAASQNQLVPGIGVQIAAGNGHTDVVRILIEHGANKDAADDYGQTALMCATAKGLVAVVEYLLEQGCDMDLVRYDGWTALHFAAAHDRLQVAHLLLRFGAKLDVRDNRGETPADLAIRNGHQRIADAIRAEELRRRDHGFKRDRSTIEGTEEHEAAKRPREEREAEEAAAWAAAAAMDESDDDDDDEDDDDEEG